jgi:hypothetical protein
MWAAWRALKDHAKSRGIRFTLSLRAFRFFAIATSYLNRTGNSRDCLTVDRIDNKKGYTPKNIQALTRAENSMKRARQDAIRFKAGFAWKEKYK